MLEYVCSGQKRKLPEIIKSAAPEEPLSPPAFTPADMSKYAFDCSNCGQRVAHAASRERAALATPSPPGRPAAVRAAPRKVHGSRRPPGGAPGQRAPQVGRLRHGLAPSSPPRPARARPQQRGVVRSTPPPSDIGAPARRTPAYPPGRILMSAERGGERRRVNFAREDDLLGHGRGHVPRESMSFMSRTPAPGERGDERGSSIAPPMAPEPGPGGGNPWPSAPPPWVDDRTTQRCMGRACTVRAPPRVPPARRPREGTTDTPTSA